jgi:hypothetical protein
MIALNRSQAFLLGFFIIFSFYAVDKLVFLFKAHTTTGVIAGNQNGRRVNTVRIDFETEDYKIQFALKQTLDYRVGDKVPVIYDPSQPTKAYLFTFVGFWMPGLLWMILPLFLWASISLSFIDKFDKVILSWRGIRIDRADESHKKAGANDNMTDIPGGDQLL